MTRTYKRPSSDYILNEIYNLKTILKKYSDNMGINWEEISIDLESVENIIIRIDKRKQYFKYFHNGTDICEFKETALYSYWINKLKPFTYKDRIKRKCYDEEVQFTLNERFATSLIISLFQRANFSITKDKKYLKNLINELLYTFRFRDISQETVIMLLDPVYLKYMLDNNVDC